MKLRISQEKLKLLLEKKKNYIGNDGSLVGACSTLLALVIALFSADFHDVLTIPAIRVQQLFVFATIINLLYILYLLYKNHKEKYTHLSLYDDIEKLSETVTEYRTLAVIKDMFSKYPNRFLVYKDKIWNCYLCLHYPYDKTRTDSIENDIAVRLSQDLHIPAQSIIVTKVVEKEGEKYSYRANEIKKYSFYYLWVTFTDDAYSNIKSDSFIIQNKEYYWKSIEELIADKNTFERNRDVIINLESQIWPQ